MPDARSHIPLDLFRGELAGLVQLPRLLARFPSLVREPRGHGRPVVVLPGYGVGDPSTVPLRAYLHLLGYQVHGWGLGVNRGHAATYVGPLIQLLEPLAAEHGGGVALVGQSLGGYVARETARRRPDLVTQAITLGTPIYAPTSVDPIVRPVTALYSKVDQVVPTSRAMGRDAATTNVEIHSTHLAMGIDPDAWRMVARRLAESG